LTGVGGDPARTVRYALWWDKGVADRVAIFRRELKKRAVGG